MSQIDHNLVSDSMVQKIKRATGINNFSDSSKIKLITDIISDDMASSLDMAQSIMDSRFLEMSEGKYLDANASKHHVYRNIHTSLNINKEDALVFIRPRSAANFSKLLPTAISIPAGTKINTNVDATIILTEAVQVNPSDTLIPISIKLEVLPGSSILLNKGDIIKFPTDIQNIDNIGLGIEIFIEDTIVFESTDEDDASFRKKAILASKMNITGISRNLLEITSAFPQIKGVRFLRNEDTTNITLLTHAEFNSGNGSLFLPLSRAIGFYLNSKLSYGHNFMIYKPNRLLIKFEVGTDGGIDSSVISSALELAMNKLYVFESNQVNKDSIELSVNEILPKEFQIKINNMSLIEPLTGETIQNSASNLICPDGFYIKFINGNVVINND